MYHSPRWSVGRRGNGILEFDCTQEGGGLEEVEELSDAMSWKGRPEGEDSEVRQVSPGQVSGNPL